MRAIIFFLTLLCTTASAWQVILYKHRGCGKEAPSGKAEYMILSSDLDMGYCAGVGWIGKNPKGNLQRDVKCRYYYNGGRNNADCNDQMRSFQSYILERGQMALYPNFDSNQHQDYKWRCSPIKSPIWGDVENALPNHKDDKGTSCRTFQIVGWTAEGFQVKNVRW